MRFFHNLSNLAKVIWTGFDLSKKPSQGLAVAYFYNIPACEGVATVLDFLSTRCLVPLRGICEMAA